MMDNRSEWQRRMGIGERRGRPFQGDTKTTAAVTETGCMKETIEHADGRIDNFYTLPTQEVG